jgi:DNA-binding transcriptional ArsR family regulator
MIAENHEDAAISRIAAAIGEPARARMLYCLMDNHARTSTELAVVANISPSTASVHLNRLSAEHLIKVQRQGKHRYYQLQGPQVASVLEGLSVLAGGSRPKFVPNTPSRLRNARTCYDHLAGTLGVSLDDRFRALGWLAESGDAYEVTTKGANALTDLGIDVEAARQLRRRFAFACLDWSERRSHIGGALGAALLAWTIKRRWVEQDLDSRALTVTNSGKRELLGRFGIRAGGGAMIATTVVEPSRSDLPGTPGSRL